jgi:hypothetical protein
LPSCDEEEEKNGWKGKGGKNTAETADDLGRIATCRDLTSKNQIDTEQLKMEEEAGKS